MYRCFRFPLLVAQVVCLITAAGTWSLARNPGDVIAEIIIPEVSNGAFGKAIGYDGRYLYYTEWAGSVLHRIDVPLPGLTSATGHIDIPIQGAPSGIMAISYDARRDAFWAIGGDGLSVYLMQKTGVAALTFTINPATDRPGDCKQRGTLWTSGCSTEVKINYDATDDTIWYAPDTSERIYHYRTAPSALGSAQLVDGTPWVDVDVPPNDMFPECGYSQVSGVAVGGAYVLVNISGCPRYFQYTKTGTKIASYPMQPPPLGDIECDNRSYSVSVIWARQGWTNGHIYAFEQPFNNACTYGGGQ